MFSASSTQVRSYVMVLILTALAMVLPSGVRGQEKIDAKARTTQYLLENTYLGHAAEMPGLDEPMDVLQGYLDQGRHGPERPNAGREITIWKKLTERYPDSRYAYSGLGRAYRARFESSRSTQDLQRAIKAYARASEIALLQGRIRYTRELSATIVQAKSTESVEQLDSKSVEQLNARSVEQLDQVFGPLIAAGPDLAPKELYLALVDYGDGLAALADERAWEHFEQAITLRPQNNIEAINRYAKRLLERDRAREALDLLESRLNRDERIRRVKPAYLRKEAMTRLGLDTSSADEEIEEIDRRLNQGTGAMTAETAKIVADIFSDPEKFVHNVATDDCRSTTYAQRAVCTSYGQCYYPYLVNLAEILWNEARGESWGQSDMVGWTVRNRALQRVSCDAYPGGTTSTTCLTALPCGDPNNCDLSKWYCCSEHGGTTTVGATHYQFNDTHVAMADLEDAATITEAYDIINGRIPDPSTGFIPPGISGCPSPLYCSAACTTGANQLSPSPSGPMEYRAYDYCAAAASCKWYAKNTCGDLPTPTNCGTYPRQNPSDNYFWNRYN